MQGQNVFDEKKWREELAQRNTITKARMLRNKYAIMRALQILNADSVEVTYEGSGDSGQIERVTVLDIEGQQIEDNPLVSVELNNGAFVNGAFVERADEAVNPLRQALENFVYDWIETSGHSGYENNDGGRGTFTINVAEGVFTLEHSDYYTECSASEYEL